MHDLGSNIWAGLSLVESQHGVQLQLPVGCLSAPHEHSMVAPDAIPIKTLELKLFHFLHTLEISVTLDISLDLYASAQCGRG
jgi:hypothetical protein